MFRAGFEVLTAGVMRSYVFWDITPCSPLEVSNVSEENVASIFRVEECVKQESTIKELVRRACNSETSVDFKWTT
jgi:hypothetical protein